MTGDELKTGPSEYVALLDEINELLDKLTAAEEQLAEMRGIVEQMLRLHEAEQADDLWVTCPSCNGSQTIGDRICSTCGGVGCDLKEGIGPVWDELFIIAKEALSAAPKRGRVVWEDTVKLEDQGDGLLEMLCTDGQYAGALYDDGHETFLDGKCYDVTVREAE